MCNFKIIINVNMWLSIIRFIVIFVLFITWTISLVKMIIKDIKHGNSDPLGLNILCYALTILLELLFILALLYLLGLVVFV